MVNNFWVKYINKGDVEHFLAILKANFALTEDRRGKLYWGISTSGITSTEGSTY
jgi:hypothetical protein